MDSHLGLVVALLVRHLTLLAICVGMLAAGLLFRTCRNATTFSKLPGPPPRSWVMGSSESPLTDHFD